MLLGLELLAEAYVDPELGVGAGLSLQPLGSGDAGGRGHRQDGIVACDPLQLRPPSAEAHCSGLGLWIHFHFRTAIERCLFFSLNFTL